MESSTTLNLQDFLTEHKFSRFQWGLYGMLLVILLFDGVAVAIAGFSAKYMMDTWNAVNGTSLVKADLTWVLSAVQLGSAVGALVAGPIADKFGRKNVVVVGALLVAVFVLISGFSANPTQMLIFRFLTGLGLGASVANCVPLFSEFCPPKRRAFLTTLMYCGFPFGSAVGGFIGGWIVGAVTDPNLGWRLFFWLMGGIPLVATCVFAIFLPESVRYMVYRQMPVAKIRATLSKIAPVSNDVAAVDSGEKEVTADEKKAGVALVMSKSFVLGSVMLWVTYFCGLVMVYSVQNWLPSLLPDHGISGTGAMYVTALFNVGALGAILIGAIMDKHNPNITLAICYALAVVAVFFIGPSASSVALLAIMVFLGGTFVNTGQSAMPALASMFYPAKGRATGVSWMIGFGKFGGFVGTALLGALIAAKLSLTSSLGIIAAIGLISVVALLVKNFVYRKQPEAVVAK